MISTESSYDGLRRRASLALLVLVNLLPLVGVLYFDWDVAGLMVLYWSENLVLGFYTLAKMLIISPLGGLGLGTFFCIHYGGFCAGHGVFITTLLLDQKFEAMPGDPWPLFLVFPQLLINVVRQVIQYAPAEWMFAFAALFASHGVSFVLNFLLGPEREESSLSQLMSAPYGRIFVLHITIIAGGIAVIALGQPIGMLLVLVLVKLGLDVKLHLRQHRKLATSKNGRVAQR